ncbi:MAG: dTMP kinase, partial [Candidatus Omnitrophica bacterium]|nr:dTMP kinase [Candidatus Omnitrophota bacterium]
MGRTLGRGRLISFEGAEGSGKSTLIRFLLETLKSWGYRVELFREPGGTSISEKIREVILDRANYAMSVECELLLYLASRAQLVREKIKPALREGKIVILDRYEDSTFVYQGYAGGLKLNDLKRLNRWATGGLSPDLTFVFDVDVRTGLSRGGRPDRMELKSLAFH